MIELLSAIFLSYIATLLITSSTILSNLRVLVIKNTPFLSFSGKHLIECRLCTGFWLSLLSAFLYGDVKIFPLIYGASYFLATQER